MDEDAVREPGDGEEGPAGAAGGNGEPRAVGEEGAAEEAMEPLRAWWGEIALKEEEEDEEEAAAAAAGVYAGGPEEEEEEEEEDWPTMLGLEGDELDDDCWIQKACRQVLADPHLRRSFQDAPPVAVLLVERYLAEGPGTPCSSPTKTPAAAAAAAEAGPSCSCPCPCPCSCPCSRPHHPAGPARPSYCYDVTIWDGIMEEKCHLDPGLNELVQKNALRCGLRVKITQCSFLFEDKKLCYGFLCIEQLEILGCSDLEEEDVQEWPMGYTPLKGGRTHYLPLWNNEDPYGDLWVEKWSPEEVTVDESKIISLLQLDTSARTQVNIEPLLVRIMHKTRLRYYGKPDTNVDVPYQAYFEVADHSGMMSMVLWNSLCPEWYKSLKIGTVLHLEEYAVKICYPFKTEPTPGDLEMKRFSSIEISLNVRDPPTKITIIPENEVKAEWKLPQVKYRFITRSELDHMPDDHSCDIIGLVQYVGRTERTRKKDSWDDFWIHRWVHVLDGTSDQPFILELFATSQPEIFEQIHPMTYLVCTQMRVVREPAENGSCTVYLTTSNESQMFVTGWHKGQFYTKDSKVKSFIQWTKTQKEDSHLAKTAMGGYYPFPPLPDTFIKYCKNTKVESVLTTIRELEKEIESLHYREHKRIAFQGIISAIRYVSCSSTSQDASGGELMQMDKRSELQTSVEENDPIEEGGRQFQQASKLTSVQKSPSFRQQRRRKRRKRRTKRKIAAVETRSPPPIPSQGSQFTRLTIKKLLMHEHFQENSCAIEESQDTEGVTQLHTTGNKETAAVSEGVQAEKMCHNSWESDLWTSVKDSLTQHWNYSTVFPESFPCKFNYEYKELFMQRYNLQASVCPPEDYVMNGEMNNFENASPLEYYEVTILGLNHDIAIDVAFQSICCPEDSHLFRAGLPNCTALSHAGGTSCPQESIGKEGHSEVFSLSDHEVVKAAANLEKQHVICILDICCLGKDKNEVFLNKVYKITEADVINQMYCIEDKQFVLKNSEEQALQQLSPNKRLFDI